MAINKFDIVLMNCWHVERTVYQFYVYLREIINALLLNSFSSKLRIPCKTKSEFL